MQGGLEACGALGVDGYGYALKVASMRRGIIPPPACWVATIRSMRRRMAARTRGAVSQLIELRQAPPYFP
jgi:hypothetical protein